MERGRSLRSGTDAIARKTHAPKANHGFGEFEFDIAANIAIVFRFNYLADDFLLGFFVGEKKQLSRRDGSGKANDGAIAKNQNRFSSLRKGFALIAALDGARAIDADRYFQCDGLSAIGRFFCACRWRCRPRESCLGRGSKRFCLAGNCWAICVVDGEGHGVHTREKEFLSSRLA
jgi:hypothetical protein